MQEYLEEHAKPKSAKKARRRLDEVQEDQVDADQGNQPERSGDAKTIALDTNLQPDTKSLHQETPTPLQESGDMHQETETGNYGHHAIS